MRLTDRKTVAELKANADRLRELGFEPSILDRRYIKLAEYEDAEELIKPTTDAEPVKHGKWERHTNFAGNYYTCTVCKNVAKEMPECMGEPIYEFCPYCGARMDGD